MKIVALPLAGLAAVGIALAVACGGSTTASATDTDSGASDAGIDASSCAPIGTTRSCHTCPPDSVGRQTCTGSGWSACFCDALDSPVDSSVCGDGLCGSEENCETCPVDCGQCASCGLAPSCSNGASLPASFTPLSDLDCADTDGGSPSCGVGVDAGPPIQDTSCLAPQLKIGLQSLNIVLDGVNSNSLTMFCIIQANDGHSSELIITPQFSGIPDHGPPVLVPSSEGTFWGQSTGSPVLSQFPITINYQCFEVSSNSTWEAVLGAISQAAGSIAGISGNPYGWAFGIASAAAAAAEAGLMASDGATMLLDFQQTIDPSSFLEMTNGKTWTVEQSGNDNGNNWDWILDLQSWGCSGARNQ